MHMLFATFTNIIALPLFVCSRLIFDHMITIFLLRITFIVVQFWVLCLIWERTEDAIDSTRVFFLNLIMNKLILTVWTLCKGNQNYCIIGLVTWSMLVGSDMTAFPCVRLLVLSFDRVHLNWRRHNFVSFGSIQLIWHNDMPIRWTVLLLDGQKGASVLMTPYRRWLVFRPACSSWD